MAELTIKQRGEPAVLTPLEYEGRWAKYLTVLEQHRVLNIRRSGLHVLVHPNQYTGTARCPAGRVRIEPRFPELSAELKRFFPRYRRNVPLPGYVSSSETTMGSDSAAIFLDALANTVSIGFPFEYQHPIVRASILSGSLDIGRTISEFDSIGIHHRAVVRQSRRTPNQSLTAIVYTVLDSLGDDKLLSPEEAAYADRLTSALPPRTASITRRAAIDLIDDEEGGQASRTDILNLCESARGILEEVFSPDDLEYAADDVSFIFTDSDALWEKAVHQCLNEAAQRISWHARLHPMRGAKTLLYPDGGPDIDPDIVVYSGTSPQIVVDAKDYTTRGADAGGVYQVDSYARRLAIRNAALFYLASEQEWSNSFGDSSVRVRAFGIPPNGQAALQHLRAACSTLVTASLSEASSSDS